MEKKLTIQIVGWNHRKDLSFAVEGLRDVPKDLVDIRYIDNASGDGSADFFEQELPFADVIRLDRNIGFVGAHNIGLAACSTEFVLIHDPDLRINWSGVRTMLDQFESRDDLGAAQGLLLRDEKKEGRNVIDSAGIELSMALNGIERGAGEVNDGQYNTEAQIIGPTGACALYRMSALRQVAHSDTEFFDADFFAYKDDVDLGWRLTRAGWVVSYLPIEVGTHRRTLGKRGLFGWGLNPVVIYRRLSNPRTAYSLRNYFWTIIKNVTLKQALIHEIFVDARLLVFLVLSVFYPPLFKTWWEMLSGIRKMLEKRMALEQKLERLRN